MFLINPLSVIPVKYFNFVPVLLLFYVDCEFDSIVHIFDLYSASMCKGSLLHNRKPDSAASSLPASCFIQFIKDLPDLFHFLLRNKAARIVDGKILIRTVFVKMNNDLPLCPGVLYGIFQKIVNGTQQHIIISVDI